MISVYGVDHHNSSIEEREKLCGGISRSSVAGQSYFVTCNRVESYSCGGRPAFAYRYDHHGEREVYGHLLNLACGLKSQLLGERQIMDQLYGFSQKAGAPTGNLIAEALAEAGQIRKRFSIAAEHTVADAVYHSVRSRGLLGEKTIVVGTGIVARMVGERFFHDSPLVFVSGKHKDRARELAARFKGEVKGRGGLGQALDAAGVLICATASPHYLITRSHPVGRCALYDLSVPRNIEPSLKAVDLERLDGEFEIINRGMRGRVADALRYIKTRYCA
jgi:glutamyl-tRNA reductase